MIVSRKAVIWSGIIIIILFAVINRIHLYMNSEFVAGSVTTIVVPNEKSSKEDTYLYEILFEYGNKTHKYDVQFFIPPDNDEQIKVMIPNGKPEDFTLFDFSHFILTPVILLVAISGVWVVFLQSFFPNQKEFYFFKKKK